MFIMITAITIIISIMIMIISYVGKDINSVCFWGALAILNYLTVIVVMLCKIGGSL